MLDLKPDPRLSWVYDTHGYVVERYSNDRLLITRADGRYPTAEERAEVERWYWDCVGVREKRTEVVVAALAEVIDPQILADWEGEGGLVN